MRSSRRMAAAVSALAVTAGGLVSAAVIGVGPARADICDPADAGRAPQGQQRDRDGRPDRNRDGRGSDRDRSRGFDDRGQDGRQDSRPDGRDQNGQSTGQGTGQGAGQGADQGFDQGSGQGSVQVDARGFDGRSSRGGGSVADPRRSPDAAAPDGRAPENQAPESQAPDGRDSDQQSPDRQAPDGQAPVEPDQGVEAPEGTPGQDDARRRGGGNQTPRPDPSQTQPPDGGGAQPSPTPTPTPSGGAGDACDLGPFTSDFVDIRRVAQRRQDPRIGGNGSRGSFVSQCGRNERGHHNPDNFIVAPGVSNGAHHLHDYVGNVSTDAFSTDESLEAAGTTCRLGDKSTYYWPVLRDRSSDANAGDPDGNVGQILRPRSVRLEFSGSPVSRVVAMPRFIRLITGDAKAATNGGAQARAAWTCTGFQNRISPDKYPLCPRGSQVVRILDFPSCWDGQNTDSANHRTHVVFPDQGGACPQGTRAIPRLRMTLTYTVPQGTSYALDAFPEQKHNPVTDHGDFVNVMPDRLMQSVVSCINRGRRC
ncbi:DUF1996 domain-containing protein [Nonomuraea maritima]|uniref:DUF1996 domain-containing protein n=1 Tax=Nonomuraea maritima TaxID=683260 RepID=UPI0037209B23